MSLNELSVTGVRNLRDVRIAPVAGLNVIVGPNASGKTSLLEAIHILGLARSFRTTQIRHVITAGESFLRVVGRVGQTGGRALPIGVERSPQSVTIRIGGNPVTQVAELAAHLPLQLLTPESHALLEQGPRLRRQFLDWGVFHVEPAFLRTWREYHRALRQRNHGLRSGQGQRLVRTWDPSLCEAGVYITDARRRYLDRLRPRLSEYTSRLFETRVDVGYVNGWAQGDTLEEALEKGFEQDRRVGHTRSGPHRGELSFKVGQVPAQQALSRGQQKLLVAAMRLAQVAILNDSLAEPCLLLIDDLAAELDREHRARLLELLLETRAQLFVTATEPQLLQWDAGPAKLFHVEHGKVAEVV